MVHYLPPQDGCAQYLNVKKTRPGLAHQRERNVSLVVRDPSPNPQNDPSYETVCSIMPSIASQYPHFAQGEQGNLKTLVSMKGDSHGEEKKFSAREAHILQWRDSQGVQ